MPLCLLYTNLKEDQIPEGLETELAECVAKVLSKPLSRLTVLILPAHRMYRFESTAPGCYLQIHSIGVFDADRNPSYTPPILDFLKTKLKLEQERAVVQYLPLDITNIGQILPS